MTDFFLPDGDGGTIEPAEAERLYAKFRAGAIASCYWPAASFTDRRVASLTSHHNGTDYRQRVGEMTSDRKFVILILESLDEHDRERYVVQTAHSQIHVDPEKVVDVGYFS